MCYPFSIHCDFDSNLISYIDTYYYSITHIFWLCEVVGASKDSFAMLLDNLGFLGVLLDLWDFDSLGECIGRRPVTFVKQRTCIPVVQSAQGILTGFFRQLRLNIEKLCSFSGVDDATGCALELFVSTGDKDASGFI